MRKHLPVLDGVRGMAALMVMGFHYFQFPSHIPDGGLGRLIVRFNTVGQTGVDLFFVLSGFLITRILIETRDKPGFFTNFYARRSLRILPLYYLFLVYFFFVHSPLIGRGVPAFSEYWWWLVYLQNLPLTFGWPAYGPGHYWSLAVEEHFYLLWPMLVFFLSRRSLIAASWALIGLSLVVRIGLWSHGIDGFYFTLTRLDALSFGALLALLEPWVAAHRSTAKRLFVGGVIALGLGLIPVFVLFSGSRAGWLQYVKYPLVAALYFAFLGWAVTAEERSLGRRFFASPAMRWVGGLGYGLYVYHGACFHWFDVVIPNRHPLAYLPLAFGFSFVVAYLSFTLFEKPLLRLKKYFEFSEPDSPPPTPDSKASAA